MKAKSIVSITLLAGALALGAPVFAASPTVHEVYLAAEAGKFTEAQTLMDQVLKEHPNSATAHFVEAELLAKQGKLEGARASLATAERLSPGLPKVNAASVAKLKATLNGSSPRPAANYNQQQQPVNRAASNAEYRTNAGQGSGISMMSILLWGGVLVIFVVLVSRFMSRRQQQQRASGGDYNPGGFNPGGAPAPGYPPGGAYPQQGYPQQGYGPGYGQQPQGSGLGSRIAGGLATGAALGAGLVAGEAIARQFTGGHGSSGGGSDQPRNDIVYDDPAAGNSDMGGNDFGVSGGWDDSGGGGGGGDDWN